MPLEHAEHAGGKAHGLSFLMKLGFRVPPGFAIVDAHLGVDRAALEHHFRGLDAVVAVRSSADVEDGRERSFAGQFTTTLSVAAPDALHAAVQACVESSRAALAAAYAREASARMHVVVQRMVDARTAGVVFTADPVSGRRDVVVVEAVAGLGEALVSGRARSQRYVADRLGHELEVETAGEPRLLGADAHRELVREAVEAGRAFGTPLDLEWAIDASGVVHWLQARPITTLGPDVALETPALTGHLYTRANVGEMLPGVVTPLTWSVFGRGINSAMLAMSRAIGLELAPRPDEPFVACFDGQLYFDLCRLYEMGTEMAGGSKDAVELSIIGQVVGLGEEPPALQAWRRAVNGLRYGVFLLRAPGRVLAMADAVPLPELELGAPAAIAAWFERALAWVDEGWAVHIASSALAGSLCAALINVFSNRRRPEPEHFAAAAGRLAGATDVESAALQSEALSIAQAARQGSRGRELLALGAEGDEALLRWLEGDAPPALRAQWRGFIARHGHRSIRESELRQPEWAFDPGDLFALLRTSIEEGTSPNREAATSVRLPVSARVALAMLEPLARQAVARRERSKSLAVRRQGLVKRAYRRLGAHLVDLERLAAADSIYFLTHSEVMRLVERAEPSLVELGEARRALFVERGSLRLPQLSVGRPSPGTLVAGVEGQLVGTPVSRGVARGRARVVMTFAEAELLQPGEILVVPHIDVGWTPLFGVAAAVVTELGSPLSHAAVVAREYGIPAVVNVPDATRRIATGVVVEVDGARGTIVVV